MVGFGHLWELVVVLLIALVIFGPKRLPELGASLGKSIREFRKSTAAIEDEMAAPAALPAALDGAAGSGLATTYTTGPRAAASIARDEEAART